LTHFVLQKHSIWKGKVFFYMWVLKLILLCYKPNKNRCDSVGFHWFKHTFRWSPLGIYIYLSKVWKYYNVLVFLKVSHTHQDCVYLIKNTVKTILFSILKHFKIEFIAVMAKLI